ncbi:MAG TPA: von Willebrand factor type A domain-containing protein [Flavobacterium sp.]|nr:von Willebrand factor type A domain-containing protein [Flavobacterium sp.]HRA72076.1 von Willebrand factor type A domain-containing protein [Flavobacterium sp.]
MKVEAIALEENNAKAKITSTYDAKTRTISGIVTDETNLPLPGGNVSIKGTNKSTSTNYDGKFSIQAEKGDTLVFQYVGFENGYATVEKSDVLNFKMQAASQALNEVVVVGYGMSKKKNRTKEVMSVASVGSGLASNLNNSNNSYSINQALQGKVAGVQITNNSGYLSQGSPGASPTIAIRGSASISKSNDPLYIIDGVPVNAGDFKQLKPENVKSIDVLKDAAATSLYGSRASNGVIILTTKNGTYQNISKKELEKRLKKLDKNSKTKDSIITPKQIEVSQEDYDNFVENQFESPKSAPLSTFSIDVDNASYTNVRRFINNGQSVPKDAVRVEEMMNFFKYKYPQPQDQHPFSINTEYSDCPWNPKHQLLKIGLQGKNIPTEILPASNLVFLIDVSGSMSDANKLPLLKQSLKILVNELRKKDKVAIVVYAGAAGMVLPPTTGDEKQTIIDALEKLNAGGSTAGGAGIELAYKLAQENFIKGGNNRVILATDGDFNVGASSNTDMQTLIEEKRKSGVFLTCLGYGMGNYKDSKMETLADKGNGNYAYIDNIQEANRFLGKEFKGSMFAIAKDVKIQIEFNPKQVQAYRLIGYENRKLRPEDFTNDAIDAGELGSNHTVTALYEVIPTGVKSEFLTNQPDLKYTKVAANENEYSDELATIKFRYKKPDGDSSIEMVKVIENKSTPLKNSSDDFKFSAAVAWFGLKLRDSNLVPNKSSEDIKRLAKEGLSNDEEGYKAEFIRLVETVK